VVRTGRSYRVDATLLRDVDRVPSSHGISIRFYINHWLWVDEMPDSWDNNGCRSPVKYSGNHLIGAVGISNERAGGGKCVGYVPSINTWSTSVLSLSVDVNFFWLFFLRESCRGQPVGWHQQEKRVRRCCYARRRATACVCVRVVFVYKYNWVYILNGRTRGIADGRNRQPQKQQLIPFLSVLGKNESDFLYG
jgi:hypothetical protein